MSALSPNQVKVANILVVDDEPDALRYVRLLLEASSYKVETATGGLEALARVGKEPPLDLVLLDVRMPGLDGLETLERLRRIQPTLKVIMLSCVTEPRKVVKALRLGAQDYIAKPFQVEELNALLDHYLAAPSTSEGVASPKTEQVFEEIDANVDFIAASPAMRKVHAQISQVARVDVPILLMGESGTGKDVAARLIHKLSPRAERIFLKINCAALPADLLESEMFGYEAGAFTGAVHSKPGKFELAQGGTIFLDEIAEMPPGLQAKLLHVLQDKEFSRLGGRTQCRVNVRVLAATNVDVRKALAGGKLRQDLYYRLNTFAIELPPLRERKEEVPLLLRHFMTIYAERFGREPMPLSSTLIEACLRYSWPGNIRELESFVKRCLILGHEDLVLADLEENISSLNPDLRPVGQPKGSPGDLKALVRGLKDQAELDAITQALEHAGWNRKRAAEQLKISYKALLYKIRRYDIKP